MTAFKRTISWGLRECIKRVCLVKDKEGTGGRKSTYHHKEADGLYGHSEMGWHIFSSCLGITVHFYSERFSNALKGATIYTILLYIILSIPHLTEMDIAEHTLKTRHFFVPFFPLSSFSTIAKIHVLEL